MNESSRRGIAARRDGGNRSAAGQVARGTREQLDALAQSRPDLHALVMDLLEHEETVDARFHGTGDAARRSGALRADSRLGPYRIIRLLGEGGMGEVWLASRDDGLYEGQVAIKTLHPYFAGGALRERFLREARVLGRLAHPNIARLLDAGIHDGVVYLVLEYVVGRPIDVACDEEKLDIAARLEIFLQLCAAVAHAHSSLVVHRDIKPGNVLLTADGVPKLLDFGIASFYEPEKGEPQSDLTRLTGRIFTPEYAAPEQVLGQEITTATDVYSLGVLLYVLLTGQLPYKSAEGGRAQWEHAVLHEEPQRLVRALDQSDHESVAASARPRSRSCAASSRRPRKHRPEGAEEAARGSISRPSRRSRTTSSATCRASRCSRARTRPGIASENSRSAIAWRSVPPWPSWWRWESASRCRCGNCRWRATSGVARRNRRNSSRRSSARPTRSSPARNP